MAHEVSAKVHIKVVARKDLEAVVKGGSTEKLGALLIKKAKLSCCLGQIRSIKSA